MIRYLKSTLQTVKNKLRQDKEYFGPYLYIDSFGGDVEALMNPELVEKYLTEAVALAGMNVIVPAKAFLYNHPDIPEDSGVTGTVILAESLIGFHSFERHGYAALDLFSCKSFDKHILVEHFKKTFNPERLTYRVVKRGRGFTR